MSCLFKNNLILSFIVEMYTVYLIIISPQKKHSAANNLSKDSLTLSRRLIASNDCVMSLLF